MLKASWLFSSYLDKISRQRGKLPGQIEMLGKLIPGIKFTTLHCVYISTSDDGSRRIINGNP